MRLGFAGTPQFAAIALETLLAQGRDVVLALTREDRPQGRGLKLAAAPVKMLAQPRGIPVLQPSTLRASEIQARLLAIEIDVLVVAAYGLLLPKAILEWPRFGALNIHASLLPRWRGAAPVQRAILAGDRETGITIMRMDEGLDTGPIVSSHPMPIATRETAGGLLEALSALGGRAILTALDAIESSGSIQGTQQDDARATYAKRIEVAETEINWDEPALAIDRQVRAFAPVPGARTCLDARPLKIWRAEPRDLRSGVAPGCILSSDSSGVLVRCGEGALALLEVQPAGGRRMTAAAFAAGRRLAGLRVGRH